MMSPLLNQTALTKVMAAKIQMRITFFNSKNEYAIITAKKKIQKSIPVKISGPSELNRKENTS